MPRPTVLVATTDPAMAYALKSRLCDPCRKLGLRLEICPGAEGEEDEKLKVRAYDCAEALFDHLASIARERPMGLADTLVILDVGAQLDNAFLPKANPVDGWHRTDNRAGVAVELILRFPQVFPMILSPAVPISEGANGNRKDIVICPEVKFTTPKQWVGFRRLRNELQTAHKGQSSKRISCANSLMALREPLHFVSPLDGGGGLISTLTRFARGMRCWFDPTGLRTLVKNRFLGTLFGNNSSWHITKEQRDVLLQRLDRVVVAVDEEREFAMFNAYTAYKFGRRGWIVITFHEFNTKPLWVVSQGKVEDVVVLRDVDLRFPDISTDRQGLRDHLKSVQNWKDADNQHLLNKQWRVRAVSSHPEVVNGIWCANEWGECCGKYDGLSKPIESLYELTELLDENTTSQSTLSLLRASEGISQSRDNPSIPSPGHGAPYVNLAMAESLLCQSKRCQDGPMEHLLGALLAHEAYELLLGMSKTTALEALLLVHKKEVAAEVEFPGVSHDISIKKRRDDVKETLNTLYGSDEPKRTAASKRLFLSQFWAELRLVYKNGEQFKAAEAANAESLVHSKWWPSFSGNVTFSESVSRIRKLGIVRKCNPVFTLKCALVAVATSFRVWVLAAVMIVFASSGLYALADYRSCELSCEGMQNYFSLLEETVLTSLGLQLTDCLKEIVDQSKHWGNLVAIGHIGLSYLLFGLLVSMLYRKVTRG